MASPEATQGSGAGNKNLRAAARNKNDEFYTQLTDIEKELHHYKEHFSGKVVFCNCDDPEWSGFWKYFSLKFAQLGLKKLIATHYEKGTKSYKLEYDGRSYPDGRPIVRQISLDGDGDFRSDECKAILQEADIVVTNPPFSLFREYVAQLLEYDKRFLVVGNKNAITYKEIFKLIKSNLVWMGIGCPKIFEQPDGSTKTFGNINWFTNLAHKKRNEELILFRTYAGHEHEYPAYDNYDAIDVGRVKDIPSDYSGYIGVPITFLEKHNPAQFEILGIMNTGEENPGIRLPGTPHGRPVVSGQEIYLRILIRHKQPTTKPTFSEST